MIDLSNRVAIVTGAGRGLGKAHALALAARHARLVVNDLDAAQAEAVADEIEAAGGAALACAGSVADPSAVEAMVGRAMDGWGRVDILVNNAGVLRDKSFGKMSAEEFRTVIEVHLVGAFNATKAVWEIMRTQKYGRIVMTSSSSGLYGNFGQTNYGAAKMALVGMMQTLAIEGAKHGIRVNCLAPTAATAMTQGVYAVDMLEPFDPALVSPAIVFLVSEEAPTRTVLCAGGGGFECAHVTLTRGVFIGNRADAADELARRFREVDDRRGEVVPEAGIEQCRHELAQLRAAG